MATRNRVIERDLGWKALRKQLEREPHHVVIGVQGDDANREGEGIDNVGLATVHEFGTGSVPERSFLRSTMTKNEKKYAALAARVAKGLVESRFDLVDGLSLLGEAVVSDVKGRIEKNQLGVPLSERTIKRKGSSTPLIDTGQLKNSITYQVRRGVAPSEGGS